MDAAGENAAAGDTTEEDAAVTRGRAGARVCRPGCDLTVLVQAADKLPAGHRGKDGCRVTS